MKIRLVVCVLTLISLNVYGHKTCPKTDGRKGMRIRYDLCPEVIENLYRSYLNDEGYTKNFNKTQYTCGFDEDYSKVRCGGDYDCYTIEGSLGKCTHVNTCPHLSAMSTSSDSEKRAYVRNSRCLNGARLVCCGPPPDKAKFSKICDSKKITAFPPDPASRCCGYDANANSKIAGGDYAAIDQYPWMVLLEYEKIYNWGEVKSEIYCGGSLISNKYVVTAAHCITFEQTWPPINVRLGEYNTNTKTDCVNGDCADPIKVIPIEEIIVHPEYNAISGQNDIALIRMASPVAFTEFVRPICLPYSDVAKRVENLELIAAGWGRVNNLYMSPSPIKKHVKLPLKKIENCKKTYNSIWDKQLCAGGEAGKDSCTGDSGGPLMLKTGLFHELVGVVSQGPRKCGSKGKPGIYTNVHSYTIWIRRNIRP